MAQSFGISAIVVGATTIHEIQESNVDPGINNILEGGDDSAYNSFLSANIIAPVATFTTKAIATAAGVCGVAGLDITSNNVAIYFQQRASGSIREGASKHVKLLMTKGIMVPTTLSGDQARGSLSYQIFVIWDGTNSPLQKSINQSLPSIDATDESFVSSEVYEGGSLIGDVVSMELNFGLQVVTEQTDGNEYPDLAYIQTVQPGGSIVTNNLDYIDTVGSEGKRILGTGGEVECFFKRKTDGVKRYANGTANHIKVAMTKGMIKPGQVGGSHGGKATLTLVLEPVYDESNPPFTLTTGTAIAT